jgi:hypothetical protein
MLAAGSQPLSSFLSWTPARFRRMERKVLGRPTASKTKLLNEVSRLRRVRRILAGLM